MVAGLPCNPPHTFLFGVKDEDTVFLVAGSDVVGIFKKFADVDFRIERKRIPVLEDTNCRRRKGISPTEDTDLLSENRNAHHLIRFHGESSRESDDNRTDDCKDNKRTVPLLN